MTPRNNAQPERPGSTFAGAFILRACAGAGIFFFTVLTGCGKEASVDFADPSRTKVKESAPSSALPAPLACTGERTGCSCEIGTAPVTCYPERLEGHEGKLVCARGTMSCRDGVWSSCESLSHYELPAQAKQNADSQRDARRQNLGAGANKLVTEPTICNPCNPQCLFAVDRPTAQDLAKKKTDDAVYNSARGGIQLRSIVDVAHRGPVNDTSVCGNKVIEGIEECDDGNKLEGDGCKSDCRMDGGWHCAAAGAPCKRTICGDALQEGSEQCDDGNLQIGDSCTPFCAREPKCAGGSCEALCGDGKVMPGEACDDGNTRNGDGCSNKCKIEAGFKCELKTEDPPEYMDLPIVYRDFRTTHPDFEHWCCGIDLGMVKDEWGPDRKPVPIIEKGNPALTTAANFNQWYRDSSASMTFADRLRVNRQSDGTYVFDSASFFPLTNRGFAALGEPQPSGKNFHFTSEVRFWFQYVPGQKLTFRGDDDVWVFINGKLAVDLGGVHGATEGSVELTAKTASTYGLKAGGLYEAAVFQAERHTTQSNYRLQLGGFFFGKTQCASVCGDGIVTSDEICDDKVNDNSAGGCSSDCRTRLPKYAGSASYTRDYDATKVCNIPPERPQWGELTWDTSVENKSSIRFEVRGAETKEGLDKATPATFTIPSKPEKGSLDVAQLLAAAGLQKDSPHLRVTATLLASKDMKASPLLREFQLRFTCIFAE